MSAIEVEHMETVLQGGSLTREEINTYDSLGYLVIPGLLNQEDMRPAQEAMAQKVSEIADDLYAAGLIVDKLENSPFEKRLGRLFEELDEHHFLKFGRSWRSRYPGYYHLMNNPKILDAVESLLGPEIFSNPVYNARPKVPQVAAGAVPWHQDKSYWPDANANPVITVWIPLVDSTHENGYLHIIPGTHRKRLLKYGSEDYSGTGYLEVAAEHVEKRKKEIIALPMAAGDAVFFNDRLIHSSTPNNSNHVRWSVDLRYQPTDQDPMPGHGAGFLARSKAHPERVATLKDWLENKPEHEN